MNSLFPGGSGLVRRSLLGLLGGADAFGVPRFPGFDVLEPATLVAQSSGLADAVTQVVELRSAGVAASDDLDLGRRGECSGKIRSTPSLATMRRTVIVSLIPLWLREMKTPWNTWMRSLVPSMIR